ncbi:MAG: protein kinase [Gemmatimonadetes bacterium]|nr:protein kinase [Gemmatimonadota bacterium]
MPKPEAEPRHAALEPATLQRGSRLFGTYEVEAELGAGGMGAVYRVRHTTTGEVRAAKVMHPQVSRDPRLEQLFTREARVLSQLRHPGVVRYLDLLRDGDRLVLLMEYEEGQHLGQRLAHGPVSPDELETLLHTLADALAAVHAADVVHRDISPDNVILRDGSVQSPTLIDFGIAADDLEGTSTIVEGFKGKLAYASPEQLGVHGTRVGPPSDVYSLGLVMAFAASGSPLPMGRTLYEAVQRRSSVPELPPEIPPRIGDLVRQMLAPVSHERPSAATLRDATTAAGFARGKREHAASKPLQAQDDGDAVTVLPPPAPNRTQPTAGPAPAPGAGQGAAATTPSVGPRQDKLSPRDAAPVASPTEAAFQKSPTIRTLDLMAHAAASGLGLGIGVALWCMMNLSTGAVSAQSVAPVQSYSQAIATTAPVPTPPAGPHGALSAERQRVMLEADRFARAAWRMDARNVTAQCMTPQAYRSDFAPGASVHGVAYDWGGNDTPELFVRKLAAAYAAGSHSWNGVTPCTAGIDCSGFVGQTWGLGNRGKLSTSRMTDVARMLGQRWRDQLLPGDALNRPGRHVVLYAGRAADGRPVVYEALAAASRVIRNDDVTWARMRRYAPMRLRTLSDG